MFLKSHKFLFLVSLFFLLGLLIRIYKLGDHNLWYDEFRSLKMIREFSPIDRDYNPPFYYLLLSFWVRSFGPILAKFFGGEFILRSLSTILGVISIPLIYKLGKLFFDIRTGLISAFILSISPLHIWYSQEARGYSLSVFLVMLTVYIFFLALQKNKFYLWMGFIVSSFLALFTNYFSFFVIILAGILFIFKSHRQLLKPYLVSLCLIFFSLLPFSPLFFKQMDMVKNVFWIPKPHLRAIAITFENFNAGYNATIGIYLFTFIIFSLLFLLGILFWWKEKKQELITLVSFIFIPIIITFLISKNMPIYLDRQMMLFSPFYYIIIAAGLTKIKMCLIKIAMYISILIPILFCLYNYFSYQMPLPQSHHIGVHAKKPVKPAADYINRGSEEGDLVALSDWSINQIFFYLQNNPKKKQMVFCFVESKFRNERYWYNRIKEALELALQKGISSNIIDLEEKSSILEVKSLKQLDFKRVWLISSSWARDGKLEPHVEAVREFMLSHYALLETKEFDGIFVELFVPK